MENEDPKLAEAVNNAVEPDGYYGEDEVGSEAIDLSFLDEEEADEPGKKPA